jgi:hypothetical protein
MSNKFCIGITKRYESMVAERDDRDLRTHLFHHYPTLTEEQRQDASYRKWRRCVIVECLKRGLIKKDPGLGPPKRR